MRLRTRLFASVATVIATTVALVTWAVSASARRAFETLDAGRTAALTSQFRREFTREGDEVAQRIDRIVAGDELTRIALDLARTPADTSAHVDAAAAIAAEHGLDFLDVVVGDGTIVSSAHWPARFGYRNSWAVEAAVAGRDAFLQPIETSEGIALGVAAARKMAPGRGEIYVAGGRWLDRAFLQSLALPAGMRALLYRNVQPDVSRQPLIDTAGGVADAAALEPLIARVRDSGREASESVEWPGGREVVHGIPLKDRQNRVIGVLLVGSSGRELDALLNNILWTGLGLGAIGLLLGGALSYLVARTTTKPVEELAEAARSVAGGNWDATVDVHATGEVADLAGAFAEMTRQLVDHRERLLQAERVAAWRELARRLAHELKNPLFPLRLTLDNLQRAKSDHPLQFDEVFEESMTTLRAGVANLTTVISRFSDFAKMPTPMFERISPNDVVREAVRLFSAQLQVPGRPAIAVTMELDPELGAVPLDAEQVGRAVQNLLLNAIDAMPRGGTITIRTYRRGDVMCLEVADTGEGLMDEERERLFTPYYTTKQHGTGLGLAIVQSVVADHGGKIHVQSRRGEGTTFRLELPVTPEGVSA
jgi:signal transduction histidine kinase